MIKHDLNANQASPKPTLFRTFFFVGGGVGIGYWVFMLEYHTFYESWTEVLLPRQSIFFPHLIRVLGWILPVFL